MSNPGRGRPERPKVSPPAPLVTKRGTQDWKLFKQMWTNYIVVAGLEIEAPAYLRALFLHTLGAEGLTIFNGLELDDSATVDQIISAMDTHFIGKTNEIYERFVFNKRDQKEGESFDDYINCLRQLIKTCNFSHEIADSLLRDRIVLGIRSSSTKQELIQDSKLTLQTCIDKCRSLEATEEQMKALGENLNETEKAHLVKHKKKREGKNAKKFEDTVRDCKFCGERHRMKREECPAWGKRCEECGAENHSKRVCFKAKRKNMKKKKSVHVVVDDSSSDDEYVLAVENTSDDDDEYVLAVGDKIIKAKMQIDGRKIICQVDNGACVNVISANALMRLRLLKPKQH